MNQMTPEEWNAAKERASKSYWEICQWYYELHDECPACGGDVFEKTCIGPRFCDPETAEDRNRARCPCGWVGIVHDLVPTRNPLGSRFKRNGHHIPRTGPQDYICMSDKMMNSVFANKKVDFTVKGKDE